MIQNVLVTLTKFNYTVMNSIMILQEVVLSNIIMHILCMVTVVVAFTIALEVQSL